MRRYLQGTLDYTCGVYAVINALSCTYGLDLNSARGILQEALLHFAERPDLWQAFVTNETDHYWVIRRTLSRWCCAPPRQFLMEQPFGEGLVPDAEGESLNAATVWFPERLAPRGPTLPEDAEKEAFAVWAVLKHWLSDNAAPTPASETGGAGTPSGRRRTAIFRFHRFFPGLHMPVVSHWTTACSFHGNVLSLHDAGAETGAIRNISADDCISTSFTLSMIRIVPESVILLEKTGRPPSW